MKVERHLILHLDEINCFYKDKVTLVLISCDVSAKLLRLTALYRCDKEVLG